MLVHRRLGQLRDVGDNGLDHPSQRRTCWVRPRNASAVTTGGPRPGVVGESPGSGGASPGRVEMSARSVLVRVRNSANVGGDRDLRRGSMGRGRDVSYYINGCGAEQCRTRSPPPRILDQLSTWSLGLTWLPPKCCCGYPSGVSLDE
ncbi:hypothetical protein B296_00030747 [Ensete ventricosum]|uniref:Uncharacterized protein n=1 Tax=Ensete ventricosum TaxID=4639 RepID=A0A426XUT6_ENSVE|nr:hypothetical protein B296_00030747 [Ensete ventricosum]